MNPQELSSIMYTGSDKEIISAIREYKVPEEYSTKSSNYYPEIYVTPLHQAIAARRINVIESLLRENYDVNLISPLSSNYPLHAIFKIPSVYNIINILNVDKSFKKTFIDYLQITNKIKFKSYYLRESIYIEILNSILLDKNTVISEDKLIELYEESNKKELIIAKLLLDHGAIINTVDKYGYTPLHFSAKKGMIDMINLLLNYGADTTLITRSGDTALEYAIISENIEAIGILLKYYDKDAAKEGCVNIKNKGITKCKSRYKKRNISNNPLAKAILTCNPKIVSFLIDSGLSVNTKDEKWKTPLHYAADMNRIDTGFVIMEIMKSRNTEYVPSLDYYSRINNYDDTLPIKTLQSLTRYNVANMIDIVKLLILNNADVNAKDKCKKTPLHYATKIPYTVEIVELLIVKGADIHAQDRYKKTALINSTDMPTLNELLRSIYGYCSSIEFIDEYTYSVIKDISKIIYDSGSRVSKLLIEHGADINVKDIYGKTPLYNSTNVLSMIDVIKILIERGADIKVTYRNGKTPLHNASSVSYGNEIVETLLMLGSDVNAKDETGNTPLHYAFATRKCKETIKILLDYGADINIKNQFGKIPLHEADSLIDDGPEIANLLIGKDYDIESIDIYGMTPLHNAIYKERDGLSGKEYEIIKQIIELGADVNAKDKYGRIPLHIASKPSTVNLLIKNGCDVNCVDVAGKTPLHYASEYKINYDLIKILISAGSNVNVKDKNGNTPLYSACHTTNTVKLLLMHGAEANITNNYGITPLEAAILESIDSAKIIAANIEGLSYSESLNSKAFKKNINMIDEYNLSTRTL